jgi:hypothetical protein
VGQKVKRVAHKGKTRFFFLFSEESQYFYLFEQQKIIFTSWSKNKSV